MPEAEKLIWVNQPIPPADGWYWVINKGMRVPLLVQVFTVDESRRIARFELRTASSVLSDRMWQWWYGPVDVPPTNPV